MKIFLTFFIAAIFLAACNNTETPAAAAAVSPAKEPAMADNAFVSSAARSGCSSILWFKEGTTLEYNLTDANGKRTAITTTHIDKIHVDGSATIADFTNVYAEGKKVTGSYRCEADKLFMDMKSFFENNFSALKRRGMEITIKQDASISFPADMKPGDKLEEATFVIGTKKAGKDFMTITIVIKDRKVEGFEKIITPGGSLNCLKLSQIQSTSTSMMGRPVMKIDTKSTDWFSADAGIVKTESYDANGKLQNRSELVSIR
jgi:hypothetical protein